MQPETNTKTRRRRGRPAGSVKLTPEIQHTVVSYIEAGAWDYVAAEAAGIDERTFRDWIARGEHRHPSRSPTPELEAFARAVREAKARARAAREITVADKEPRFWLSHAARSRPGREGWSEPIDAPDGSVSGAAIAYEPSPEELAETLRALVDAGAIPLPPCTDPTCGCKHHEGGPRGER